jgi:PncC family amidohydrolase
LIQPVTKEVLSRLGDFVFTTENEELEEAVGRLLRGAGRTLACAESLTGGELSARITSVPGSSDYFLGSAVTYAASAKASLLGVSQETLDGPGTVSRECALEMAAGARALFDADIAVSLTGAAGPEPHGGQRVGQVWAGFSAEGVEHARGFIAPGDREQIRRWSEQAVLDLVRRHLEGLPLPN